MLAMSLTAHWILTAVCAVLGIVDILLFVKTPKENKLKLHYVLLVCGIAVIILAILNAVKLISAA